MINEWSQYPAILISKRSIQKISHAGLTNWEISIKNASILDRISFSPVKVGLGYNSHNCARIFNNRSYFFPFFRRAKLKKLTMKHFIDLMILLPSRNLCFSHILENRIIIKTFLAVLLHTFLYYFHFPSLHFHFILFCLRSFSFSHLAVYHGYYKWWREFEVRWHHIIVFFSPWENFQGKLSSNSCFV